MKTIEINGVKYREKEQPRRKPMSKSMTTLLTMASMLAASDPFAKNPRKDPEIDFVKEYGLIQLKKSTLSKRNRDYCVRVFNKHFEKI